MLATLLMGVAAFAQIGNDVLVKWTSHIEKADGDNEYRVIFTGKIAEGYHTYTLSTL